ncbi:hypothetical protein ACFU6K_32210 [Kitasatospora sp. NPDC057512]|uniref:hypothetical protein n=1 Tax=Kitasatospora sp. NPDC057512 TaxID=3346154 RepID=UPI0036C5BB55
MENEGEGSRMTVGRRRITTAVPGSPLPGAPMPGVVLPGAADPALTVRRYIDHALICSACCR